MSNEDTNNKEGEEMFRNVLFTMVCGLLLGGGLIGCGEDSPPAGGGKVAGAGEDVVAEGEGQGEGEGEGSPNEGEGSPPAIPDCTCNNVCTEEDDPIPDPDYNDDGRECPQDFAGMWWLEISDIDTHGSDWDPLKGNVDAQFWSSQEITLEQDGCFLKGPADRISGTSPMEGDDGRGAVYPEPSGFCYTTSTEADDVYGWITWSGNISNDRQAITGTCKGTYPDVSKFPEDPSYTVHITCSFVMTRRN